MPFKFNPFSGNFDEVQDISGKVDGPASSTDDAITRYDGTTGKLVQNSTVTLSDAGAIAGASIDADSNTITNIEDADIKAGAAISLDKLAALTADRALQSSASGVVEPSSVTSTELGYVSGVTSSIQSQLNAKLNLSGGTMTGALTLNADAVNPLEAATKQQLDAAINGIQRKSAVIVATTGNITLSGEQTIDGVLTSTSRVLVKDQTNQDENGIYISAAGAWARSSDANSSSELNHAIVSVQSGSTHANTAWEQTTDNPNIGVDNIVWIQAYGAGSYTADESTLTLSGSVFSINTGGVSNAQVNAAAAIAYSKLDLTGSILDADINTSAAIGLTKLAATTANRALSSDASGFIVASTVTDTELGYLSGVTSAIQSQINGKQDTITGGATTITSTDLTASRALESDGSGKVAVSSVTSTELGYVSGVTSSIQTQLDSKSPGFSFSSISGITNAAVSTTYLTNSSGGGFTITLPAPSSSGEFVRVKTDGNAFDNPVIVAPNGAENIDGSNSNVTLDSNYEAKMFVSDGTDWYIF